MDKELEENPESAMIGSSKDGERISNCHKQEQDEQKVFRNNRIINDCQDENSVESNVEETNQGELKNMIEKNKIVIQPFSKDTHIYDKNSNGETLLYAAFKEGRYDTLQLELSKMHANLNPSNKDDVLHFHIACVMNHYVAAERFLKCGIDPNSPLSLDSAKYSGLSPIEFAIKNKYFKLFGLLVKYNGDLSVKNDRGLSPLHMIYHSNLLKNKKAWIRLAFKHGNDKKFINSVDKYGVSHFHLCCILNDPNMVTTFINNGVNVNDSISLTCPLNPGFTPLHFAVFNIRRKVTQLLLRKGADPNKPDKAGRTPLLLACEKYGYLNSKCRASVTAVDIVDILLEYKADPVIADMKGCTPLHESIYNLTVGNHDIFDQLVSETDWGLINCTDNQGLSFFHIACAQNNKTPIINFLNSGVNINSRVSSGIYSGFTALHFAVIFNQYANVKILLSKHAKVNEREDKSGSTPLHVLFKKKFETKLTKRYIKLLLRYHASLVITDKAGRTPLHASFYATNSQGFENFDYLISKVQWGSVNCTDKKGLSLFHIACSTDDVEQVIKFLDSGVNVDSRVSSGIYRGFTALHFAAKHNQKAVVDSLLKRNAKINVTTDESEVTPLHLACKINHRKFEQEKSAPTCSSNQKDIINLLISHGANVNAKDSSGKTPLHYICTILKNHEPILSAHDENLKEEHRLHKGISVRLQEIIEILVSNKADVNARTNNQSTILHIISGYRNLEISEKLIEVLLTLGVDVNAVDDNGLTPLHVAVKCNNNRLVKSLLKHNANPNIRCINSRIPLQITVQKIREINDTVCYCQIRNMKDIFATLLESGSDVNVRDEHGRVLLHDTIRSCNCLLTEKLLKYGADINMEDSFSNCSISYLLEHDSESNVSEILKIIFSHVSWLKALKIPLSQKVKKCRRELFAHFNSALQESGEYVRQNEMYIQCQAELDIMKNIKLDNYTSLYDILRKDPHELITHVANENLIKIEKDENFHSKFPLYGHLLQQQFKRGLIRKEVTQFADVALRKVLNINLPNLCCDLVLKYLTNEEIATLVKAAPVKRNFKRILCDSSSQNETLKKMKT